MATAPNGWPPLLATGSNDAISSPCPLGPGVQELPLLLVPVRMVISVNSFNPALTKSSTLLSVLLFPAKTRTNPDRGLREAEFMVLHEAKCFSKAQ